jgi:UDPglucose--hexose-1-phosphate uridylyltransferase
VVPNKFPALRIEGELDRHADGMYDAMNGIGAHEIVIETPDHHQHTADQPVAHLARVLRAYRDRQQDLMQDRRFVYVVIFRNYGESAGATLAHPHSQIMALPVLPQVIETELESARRHFEHRQRCLFCDILRHEIDHDVRVVQRSADFVAIAPYASRSPFEIFIAPTRHRHDFSQLTDTELLGLAGILRDTAIRLRTALNNPPYNFVLHNSPNLAAISPVWGSAKLIEAAYHWHIELIPRLTKPAGFEWGTGFHINPTPPEQAAEYLRGLAV